MSTWKLIQRRCYDLLSYKYSLLVVLLAFTCIFIGIIHFGEVRTTLLLLHGLFIPFFTRIVTIRPDHITQISISPSVLIPRSGSRYFHYCMYSIYCPYLHLPTWRLTTTSRLTWFCLAGLANMEQGEVRGGLSLLQRQYLRDILPKEIVPTRAHRCGLHMGKRIRSTVLGESPEARPCCGSWHCSFEIQWQGWAALLAALVGDVRALGTARLHRHQRPDTELAGHG